jgi:hypothetical protein
MNYSKVRLKGKVYLGHVAQSGFWISSSSRTQGSNPLLLIRALFFGIQIFRYGKEMQVST